MAVLGVKPPIIRLPSVFNRAAADLYNVVSPPHTNCAVVLVGNGVLVAVGKVTWLSKPSKTITGLLPRAACPEVSLLL